jgi:hypothetical protein
MRASKAGWGAEDLDVLYIGFGFDRIEGANHRLYVHGRYPGLRATVGRHSPLAIGYVVTALRLVDQVISADEEDPELE